MVESFFIESQIKMTADGTMILAIYIIACVAVLISVYALFRVSELVDHYTKKSYKPGSVYEQYEVKKENLYKKSTSRGYWDKSKAKGHWD
jgi:hypothetical protein